MAEDEKDNSTAIEALPGAMEFTAEKTDGGTFLYTEYKGLLLCWSQGEGETGKGGDDEDGVEWKLLVLKM